MHNRNTEIKTLDCCYCACSEFLFFGGLPVYILCIVVGGRFPVSRELAAELGALMAQLDMGDYSLTNTQHKQPLAHRFYPFRYRAGLTNDEMR